MTSSAHNLYSDNCSLNHKILAAHNAHLIPFNTGKLLIGVRYQPAANITFKADNQRHFAALMDQHRREKLDKLVTYVSAASLIFTLIAARWI